MKYCTINETQKVYPVRIFKSSRYCVCVCGGGCVCVVRERERWWRLRSPISCHLGLETQKTRSVIPIWAWSPKNQGSWWCKSQSKDKTRLISQLSHAVSLPLRYIHQISHNVLLNSRGGKIDSTSWWGVARFWKNTWDLRLLKPCLELMTFHGL